jgi:predicted nuclease of predicted toxin-antitoxin system
MKILIDMNLSLRLVTFLVDAGIPATHWRSVGAAGAPDTEIMAYAKANDFVVLTHDLDFGAIPARNERGQAERRANQIGRLDA